jgi:hypothetical protein
MMLNPSGNTQEKMPKGPSAHQEEAARSQTRMWTQTVDPWNQATRCLGLKEDR